MRFIERAHIFKELMQDWKEAQSLGGFTDDEIKALATQDFYCKSYNLAQKEGLFNQENLYARIAAKVGNSREYVGALKKINAHMKDNSLS